MIMYVALFVSFWIAVQGEECHQIQKLIMAIFWPIVLGFFISDVMNAIDEEG